MTDATTTDDLKRPATLTMYGATWCRDCRNAKRVLDARGTQYVNVDLVAEPLRADDAESISGRKNIPVVVFPDGDFLVEPTDAELTAKLDAVGL